MFHCTRCWLAMATLGWCSACGSDDPAPAAAEDPAEHACEHVEDMGTPLTAATDRASASVLAVAEEPYAITLPTSAPGFVKIEAPLEGLLFVGTADVVTGLFRDASTTSEPLEAAPNEFCADDIPEHFDLDLDSGSLTVQLGPSAVSPVWVLLADAAGHQH
jgi:hypothetical protein